MKICTIQNCDQKIKGHGFCNKHLIRFRKYGNPLFTKYDTRFKTCTIQDCKNKYYAKGLCDKHYQRLKNHNNINHERKGKYNSAEEAYLNQVINNGIENCWGWNGAAPTGYGQLKYNKENWLAHRFSYTYYFGKIPDDMFVCHKCDNPICSNPGHLFLGTSEQNFQDMRKKNRHAHGEKCGNSRINEQIVIEIIDRLNNNEKMIQISRQMNVSYTTINSIKRNKTWKHISRSGTK